MVPEERKNYINEIDKRKQEILSYNDTLNTKAKEFFSFVDRCEFNSILNPFIKSLFEKYVPLNAWRSSRGDLLKIKNDLLCCRMYRCKRFDSLDVIQTWNKGNINSNIFDFIRKFEPELVPLIEKAMFIIEDVDEIKVPDKNIELTKTINKPLEYLQGSWGGLKIQNKTEHTVKIQLTSIPSYQRHSHEELKYMKEFSGLDSEKYGLFLDDECFETYKMIYQNAIGYYEALIKDVTKVKNRAMNVLIESKYGPELTALQI